MIPLTRFVLKWLSIPIQLGLIITLLIGLSAIQPAHVAHAQTVLVSNLAKSVDAQYSAGGSTWIAQAFTTDASPYQLESVILKFQSGAADASLRLYGSSSGDVGSFISNFGAGTLVSGNDYRFVPASTVYLAASTTYWIAMSSSSSTFWHATSDQTYTGPGAIPTVKCAADSYDGGVTWPAYYPITAYPYMFEVRVDPVPEMDLKQGVTAIADGGSHDFGSQVVSSNTDVVFTIENNGNANLILTTPVTIGGANADQFSIQAQPTSPVAASGSTTFTVRFTPTSAGAKTATISIANNDSDENPYDINLQGTGDGELQCGGTGTYTFSSQSGVVIEVTDVGTNLGCLLVNETAGDHPNATGVSGGSGIKTGKYWTLSALQSDKTSAATEDYVLNLTLPHSIVPHANAKVCKYTGGAGYGWDCDRTASTATTVTRNGISSLSDWAVGNNVGPTAVELNSLKAQSPVTRLHILAGLAGLALVVCLGAILVGRKRPTSG